jgi:3-hydroxyacyl-CoA dehydrogenase / 3-hydroxy-2-methylbutyryl-CoA dehydrogenase
LSTRVGTGAAIVTGGASGLGAATVKRLHAAGYAVLVADVNDDSGAALVSELGERASFEHVDVTDASAVERAAAAAAALSPDGVRVSVACAGIGWGERILSKRGVHDPDAFRRVIDVNLIGTFHLLRAAAAQMQQNEPIENERGVHVSTASVAAFDGQIGQIAYSASKGGVHALTLPAARDLAQHGIRVCCVAPGTFDTPLLAQLDEKFRVALAEAVPFPSRLGQPEEFAELVHAIVSIQMLNAETIRLDGAIRMPPR